jgi:hypothetical protein
LERTLKETVKQYEKAIASKEAVIEDQSSKMTYMTNEFENMLNVTPFFLSNSIQTFFLK